MSTTPNNAASLPDPKIVLFARGVIAILYRWPVLRLAVQESWGGPHAAEKREWIASTIVDAFETDLVDQDQIEELLLDAMVEEFETEVEDGSSQAVARDIVDIWRAACEGQTDIVVRIEADADKLASREMESVRSLGNGDDEWADEDVDEEDVEAGDVPLLLGSETQTRPKAEPVVDNDGFELVQKGRGKGH